MAVDCSHLTATGVGGTFYATANRRRATVESGGVTGDHNGSQRGGNERVHSENKKRAGALKCPHAPGRPPSLNPDPEGARSGTDILQVRNLPPPRELPRRLVRHRQPRVDHQQRHREHRQPEARGEGGEGEGVALQVSRDPPRDLPVHRRVAHGRALHQHDTGNQHEPVEQPVVALAHAAPDPEAVVVELGNAAVAVVAVLRAQGAVGHAEGARALGIERGLELRVGETCEREEAVVARGHKARARAPAQRCADACAAAQAVGVCPGGGVWAVSAPSAVTSPVLRARRSAGLEGMAYKGRLGTVKYKAVPNAISLQCTALVRRGICGVSRGQACRAARAICEGGHDGRF